METTLIKPKTTVTISLRPIPPLLIFMCTVLTGFVSQTVLNFVILGACVAMLIQGNIFLVYPFMIFYAPLYGSVFGLSVYRLYTLLVMAGLLLKARNHSKIKAKHLVPVAIYIVYAMTVVASYSIVDAVYTLINVFSCMVITVGCLQDKPENTRRFFEIYVLVALAAIFTGFMGKNALIDGTGIEHIVNRGFGLSNISRFTATFEDPNYMGFFFTIAVFATVTLRLFSPMFRIAVVIVLYAAIFASLSMTALVVNILLWIVFLMITQRMNIKLGVGCLVLTFLLINLYQYGVDNPNAPILGGLSYRIHEKLTDFLSGDMVSVTTGRTKLAKAHFDYYMNLPFWRLLIGGIPVNASYIHTDVFGAAHNEYIDMLLNVGLIGTMGMLWYMGQGVYLHVMKYHKHKNEVYLCSAICKCVWFAYAFALTMFLEFRFMFPFFI